MQYSTNFNLNKPERADQYNLDHWNGNTDIIDTELNALQNITNSTFKTALLNFCYPVGSLYWSSKSTNPASLFGGTWVQIKDRFVLACGDTYKTVGATGGSKTVTLTEQQIPNHTHTFRGTAVTSSGMSGNATGSFASRTLSNLNPIVGAKGGDAPQSATASGNFSAHWGPSSSGGGGAAQATVDNEDKRTTMSLNVEHTHSVTASGTNLSTGGGQAHDNMPPYVVKYCWERTA